MKPEFNISLVYSRTFSIDPENPESYQMDYVGASAYPQFGEGGSYGKTSYIVVLPKALRGKGTATCELISQNVTYSDRLSK